MSLCLVQAVDFRSVEAPVGARVAALKQNKTDENKHHTFDGLTLKL